jgi:cellulose synthase/poly-beta-1,6-N-acetylglucosamine synthase-like glycosyltransferase
MIFIVSIFILITAIYFFSIAWVIVGFVSIKKRDALGVEKKARKISIIIPVRNEAENIIKCLNTLKNQNFNKSDFELIIVNDHSIDNTENVINAFTNTTDLDVSLCSLSDDRTSKKEALKYGIEKSKYDIIATTDADCSVPENWLKNISLNFNTSSEMLLGPVMFNHKGGFLSSFQMLDLLAIQGMEFGAINFRKPILNNAANLSYLKKTYYDVGGLDDFNTPSGDDIFLLEKFRSRKKEINGLLSQDFVVETDSESTIKGFLNQRLRWSSKTKYYSDKTLIYFSSIVFIQNVLLIFVYLGIALVEKYTIILIILLFCKWLIDFILLFLVASFFKRKRALFYFIPAQIVYPIYIIMIWLASMTLSFEWKGRNFNG